MSDRGGNSFGRFLRRHATFIAWTIFLASIFGFGWYKSAENEREFRAMQEWNEKQARLSNEGMAEYRRLVAHFGNLQSQQGSQKTLQDELNGGQPFELRSKEGVQDRQVVEWSHPKYGGSYAFEFENGVLRGISAGYGGVPESLHPRPAMYSRTNFAERVRAQIARFAGYLWLIALAGWYFFRTWRVLTAQVLLVLALAYGMAQTVNPAYSVTWRGIFSNDPLFFVAIMILFSVAMLAVSLASQLSVRPKLSSFRFRLRDLLVALTVVAIAFAAGPFGYTTLAFGAIASLVFAAFFYWYQPVAPVQA
jgi:hypothetical protein